MNIRRIATPAIALTAAIGLAACGTDTGQDTSLPAVDVNEVNPTATEDSTDDTDNDDTDDDSNDDRNDDRPTTPDVDAVTAAGLAAIATAEAHTGGAAYAIDDHDSDTWEVDVAVDGATIEVDLNITGTEVIDTDRDDDLDRDERRALEGATVSLAEAIERTVAETGGILDEAELDDDDDTYHWDVSVLVDGDDRDYRVDLTTGEVTRD